MKTTPWLGLHLIENETLLRRKVVSFACWMVPSDLAIGNERDVCAEYIGFCSILYFSNIEYASLEGWDQRQDVKVELSREELEERGCDP